MHGFFVSSSQHHLGATALTLGSSMRVERLGREILGLCKDIIIKVREHRGVETDVILDQHNHLHTRLMDIVLDVHLVLNQLDDREYQIGIAQPAEHIVEDGHILMLNALGNAMRERSQHNTRNMGSHLLDIAGNGKSIVVSITRHTDNEVDIGSLQHIAGLLGS